MLIMIKLNVCNNLDQKCFLFKNVDFFIWFVVFLLLVRTFKQLNENWVWVLL